MIRTLACTIPWMRGGEVCERCNFQCDEEGYLHIMPVPLGATVTFDGDEILVQRKLIARP